MRRASFHYELPPELIATHPPARRGDSRLLVLDGGGVAHRRFRDLLDWLRPGDLLVFNDTRVIPARLRGHKDSGGRIEVLIERLLADPGCALAQVRASKAPRAGSIVRFAEDISATVIEREGDFYQLRFHGSAAVADVLERIGEVRCRCRPISSVPPRPSTRSGIRQSMPVSRAPWQRPPPDCISIRACWMPWANGG